MYGLLYKRLIYPAYHTLIQSGANAANRELASHDQLSADELRRVCAVRMAQLLEHAQAHVPFYSSRLSDEAITAVGEGDYTALQELPVMTKAVINAESKRLISASLENNRLDPNSTSGSTGSPLKFYTDKRSKAFRKATVARNRRWIGIDTGDVVAHLWGSPIDHRKASSLRGKLHGLITRERFLSAYQMSDADLALYVSLINGDKAKLLIGYPSALQSFGEYCVRNGLRMPSLKAIVCSAEALYAPQREAIESLFGIPVFNRYGCREVGDIAHETPFQPGMVVNSDRIYLEIVDENGQAVAPGQTGNLLVTDLDNYGMPLIRYDIGDRGSWATSQSGRLPYPVLETVEGRSLDVVVCPNGNRIGGTFWTILLRNRPGLRQFRVIQTAPAALTVEFLRDPAVDRPDFDYFTAKIHETCGEEMSVQFEEVDAIDVTPGGKARLVESRLEQQAPERESVERRVAGEC